MTGPEDRSAFGPSLGVWAAGSGWRGDAALMYDHARYLPDFNSDRGRQRSVPIEATSAKQVAKPAERYTGGWLPHWQETGIHVCDRALPWPATQNSL